MKARRGSGRRDIVVVGASGVDVVDEVFDVRGFGFLRYIRGQGIVLDARPF
jgi:hypothetical protein